MCGRDIFIIRNKTKYEFFIWNECSEMTQIQIWVVCALLLVVWLRLEVDIETEML